jgi:hypothetical protein
VGRVLAAWFGPTGIRGTIYFGTVTTVGKGYQTANRLVRGLAERLHLAEHVVDLPLLRVDGYAGQLHLGLLAPLVPVDILVLQHSRALAKLMKRVTFDAPPVLPSECSEDGTCGMGLYATCINRQYRCNRANESSRC